MLSTLALLFVCALPQAPTQAADEAKARTDLAHAAQHLDELLRHADAVKDRAKAALDLARSSEAVATQADRARLAKLAADLGVQLASLHTTIETHAEAIRALRVAITPELPPAAEGTVPWFRDRMQEARKLPNHKDTKVALKALESRLDGVKGKPGAESLLGHVRYLLAEAIRAEAMQAQAKNRDQDAVLLLRDASKKLEEVLACPDATDTGEGSSLHATALGRRVEIEATLHATFDALAKRQASDASTAKRHGANAMDAFERLNKVFPEATLPDGQRVVDAARATVERLRTRR